MSSSGYEMVISHLPQTSQGLESRSGNRKGAKNKLRNLLETILHTESPDMKAYIG